MFKQSADTIDAVASKLEKNTSSIVIIIMIIFFIYFIIMLVVVLVVTAVLVAIFTYKEAWSYITQHINFQFQMKKQDMFHSFKYMAVSHFSIPADEHE